MMDLTDEQWRILEPLIPKNSRCVNGSVCSLPESREILNGIFWALRTGENWKRLPDCYPSHDFCKRRWEEWTKAGVFNTILEVLAQDLKERGGIDVMEFFNSDTFVVSREAAQALANRAAIHTSWPWQTALLFLAPRTQQFLAPASLVPTRHRPSSVSPQEIL